MATTYTTLKQGSSGSDVTKLQNALISAGYDVGSTGADGIYGKNTAAAVRAYQSANGLSVDGIAGNETLGSLYSAKSADTTTGTTGATSSSTDATAASQTFQYDAYQESDAVKQAQAMLQEQLAQKPGAYESSWTSQLDAIMAKILGREDFSYDLNGDALYQQYKDQYTMQGRTAMMDTMGQAAALTGGYGNSYAQTAGQQAYQGYLQELNSIVPDLYQLAYDRYTQEGQDLYDQASLVGAMEEQEYGRYRDSVSDYHSDLDYLTSRYDSERDYDYSKYADDRDFAYGQFSDDKAYAYQVERDAVSDAQWQAEFDEAKRQYDLSYALSKSSSSSSKKTSDDSEEEKSFVWLGETLTTENDDKSGYLWAKTYSDAIASGSGTAAAKTAAWKAVNAKYGTTYANYQQNNFDYSIIDQYLALGG